MKNLGFSGPGTSPAKGLLVIEGNRTTQADGSGFERRDDCRKRGTPGSQSKRPQSQARARMDCQGKTVSIGERPIQG